MIEYGKSKSGQRIRLSLEAGVWFVALLGCGEAVSFGQDETQARLAFVAALDPESVIVRQRGVS